MRENGRDCQERSPPRSVVHDVGVFLNPIQGLFKLNGIFKLPTSPAPAFPIELGDNHPMTSSKKTCVPQEARVRPSSYPAWSPLPAGDLEPASLGLLETQCVRESAGLLGVGCCSESQACPWVTAL